MPYWVLVPYEQQTIAEYKITNEKKRKLEKNKTKTKKRTAHQSHQQHARKLVNHFDL